MDNSTGQDPSAGYGAGADDQGQGQGQRQRQRPRQTQGSSNKFPNPDTAEEHYNHAVGNDTSTTAGGIANSAMGGAGDASDDTASVDGTGAAGQMKAAGAPTGAMQHLPHWTHHRALEGLGLVAGKLYVILERSHRPRRKFCGQTDS